MGNEWKLIEVEKDLFIPFQWMDNTHGGQSLGHAEFQVCLKFKRKRVSEFWVYPRQQRDMENYWHYSGGDIYFAADSYHDLERPNIWMISYCPEHKTQSLHIYVPKYSKYLFIDHYGVHFTNMQW